MNDPFVGDELIQNVIDRYSDTVFRVSYQYVSNAQDAEDVVQEVLLGLLDYLHRANFQSDEHMKAWLIRVAINKSKNVAKTNARRRKKEAAFFPAAEEKQPFDDLETVLGQLSALDRETVYLHYYEGYSAKEIAVMLGKTESSIFKRLSRARDRMKEFLSEGEES